MNIFNALVNFAYESLITFIQFLPEADPQNVAVVNDYWQNIRNYMITVNWIFPVNTLMLFISIMIAIELSLFLWQGWRWVTAHITLGHTK